MDIEDYGEFGDLAGLLVLRDRLRTYVMDMDAAWLLPANVLPGVTRAYRLPVIRAEVDRPMIALTGE